MERQFMGRVRLNITRNSRGYGYDFTLEDDDIDPEEVLAQAEAFKDLVEARVKQWTLDLAEETIGA